MSAHKTVELIRLENRKGEGVYGAGVVRNLADARNDNAGYDPICNPAPINEHWEGSGEALFLWTLISDPLGGDPDVVFGFHNKSRVADWFDDDHRKEFSRHGIVTNLYHAPAGYVLKGTRQALFDRTKAKHVARLDPVTLEPLPAST